MNPSMKTPLLKFNYQAFQSFVGLILAFNLFGLFQPDQITHKTRRHDSRVVHFNRSRQSDSDNIYTPPRSPGFNELAGG